MQIEAVSLFLSDVILNTEKPAKCRNLVLWKTLNGSKIPWSFPQ